MRQECEVTLEAMGPPGTENRPESRRWTHATMPFNAAEVFGSRARIPVTGTINGFSFRTSLMPRGDGTHSMAVNKTMLAGARAAQGDRVRLVLEVDATERTITPPPELEQALAAEKAAAKAYHALAYSHQKEYAGWIASARREQTRATRVQKSVEMLLAGKRSPV